MNQKKTHLPIYIGIAIAIGILIGSFLNFNNSANSIFNSNSEEAKIKRLIDYIEYDYVDQVDTGELLDGAIQQIVSKLDPHSVYFTKKELEQENEQMQGNFQGIGVQFIMHKDSVVITKILKGGPSEKVGLKAGDRILIANKDTLSGWNKKLNSDNVMSVLKGESDTEVNLTLYRPTTGKLVKIDLNRGDVPISSVSVHFMLDQKMGLIKIDRFARTTYDEFKKALDNLISQGMQILVLDLRDNPGGYMTIAEKIVDELLEDNKLIVFTKNKRGEIDKDFATKKGSFENGQVYVLINENSASASEIVAGALQDNDRGIIIGRRSFGKGLVQQVMGLGDGSAVRLTTSRYYTPTGRSIQKPYTLSHGKEYFEHFSKRLERGELVTKDSIKVNDTLKFVTPKGKIVYGGGGIVPDVFVPIDTTQFIKEIYVSKLNEFAFDYVDENRETLEKLAVDEYFSLFDDSDTILNQYIKKLDTIVAVPNDKKKIIKRYLQVSIARNIYDENKFYKIYQKGNKMIEKVYELEKAE